MPGMYVTVTPDVAAMDAINQQIAQSGALMNRSFMRAASRLSSRMKAELRVEPGPPAPGITRLMTPRQRRAYFATNGFGKGIPTVRDHTASQGWEVNYQGADDGGSITAENDVPYIGYLEGDDQQPFHAATGWLQAAPIISRYADLYEDVLDITWETIADPTAGV